ncbi:MAG: hypothetical protein J6P84_01505 [Alphaproteobacteria bacterium]|nr:hypothetical protein [Alphaproteobacteria bacterium]
MRGVVFVLCWSCLWSVSAVGGSGLSIGVSSQDDSAQRSAVSEVLRSEVGTNGQGRSMRRANVDESFSEEIAEKLSSLNCKGNLPRSETELDSLNSIFKQKDKQLVTACLRADSLEKEIDEWKERDKINQQKIDEQSQVISEKERGLEQSRTAIILLEEKDRTNQQTIEEQNQIIRKQTKNLDEKSKEVSFLREQVILRERQNKSYEDNFSMIENAVSIYATSWAGEGDFREKYDSAETLGEKVLVVFAHLIEHNAKNEGISRKEDLASSSQVDLTTNTIVDAGRHDFLTKEREKNSYTQMGRYEYKGDVNEENIPHGKGEISDKNKVMSVKGIFRDGFLVITESVFFSGAGFRDCEFRFPVALPEKYVSLISFIDISEMVCSFRPNTLILKPIDSKKVGFVFNMDFIYVGIINTNDKPHGQGIKFCKNGSIQEGRFEKGFLVDQVSSTNPVKRRRKE